MEIVVGGGRWWSVVVGGGRWWSVVGGRWSVVGGRRSEVRGQRSEVRKTVKACSRFGQELFATRPGGPKTREAREARLSQVGGWRATAESAVKEMRKGCPRRAETSELDGTFAFH